eukprot:11189965-Lingulodinium_polyedra.AAC.1
MGAALASRRSSPASAILSRMRGDGPASTVGEPSSPPCRPTRFLGGRGRAMGRGMPPGARALVGNSNP